MRSIDELRAGIDLLDKEILDLLKKRKILVKDIGKYKSANNLKIIDRNRERQVLSNISNNAKGLDPKFVEKLYTSILKNSRAEQKKHSR